MPCRYALYIVCVLSLSILAACTQPTPTATPILSSPTPQPAPGLATIGPTNTPLPAPTATPLPTPTPGSGALREGGAFSQEIRIGHSARYAVDGKVGEAIRVEATTADAALDLSIVVVAAGERELLRVNRAGPGEPEVLPAFSFPLNLPYDVRIEAAAGEGFMEGALTFLSAEQLTGGGDFGALPAQAIDAQVDAPDTFHLYTFDAKRDQLVKLYTSAESEDLDLYFYVFTPGGAILGLFDDELAPNTPYMRDRVLDEAGTYAVLVGAKAGEGAYQMAAELGE